MIVVIGMLLVTFAVIVTGALTVAVHYRRQTARQRRELVRMQQRTRAAQREVQQVAWAAQEQMLRIVMDSRARRREP